MRSDACKSKKFEKGLKPKISAMMAILDIQSYAQMVQKAKTVDDQLKEKTLVSQGSGTLSISSSSAHALFDSGASHSFISNAFVDKMDVPPKNLRHNKKGRLSPRYIGLYEILTRIGPVEYRLALPPSLEGIHNVFHVSMLKKYILNPTPVLSVESEKLETAMSYEERPEKILDYKEHNLRNRTMTYVKVWWRNHTPEEASWEREEEMWENILISLAYKLR
ncbi:uncharacterized protein LOC122665443 [Telopea speciosissima]|uniref:uncharacterized protein LOC122665443 n=1 Tax=Telopea speciosissima TaxID=54955 RepID=UPI001CC63197|nr:uncharacterized protein LOC122665443 [Telopea speciosissima]